MSHSIKLVFRLWDLQKKQLHKTARVIKMEGLWPLHDSIKMELSLVKINLGTPGETS